jgi:hypothetical protein
MKWLMGQQYESGNFGVAPASEGPAEKPNPRRLRVGDVPAFEPLPIGDPPAPEFLFSLAHFRIFILTPFGNPMSLKSESELIIMTSKSKSCIITKKKKKKKDVANGDEM